jgi:carbamoyl-phosphate synthase large subunit
MENAIEAEIDAASDGKGVIGTILEHVEEAGIHSGDATMSIPYRQLSESTAKFMKEAALRLARELEIKGPFNLQFVVKDNIPYIIELNLRASRSMPFTSKAKGFNLIEKAVEGIVRGLALDDFYEPTSKYWAVKSPQFSWAQIKGAYPFLGPEMRSTGEAASFGVNFEDALLKSWLSTMPNRIPENNKSALIYGKGNNEYLKKAADNLSKFGMNIYTLSEQKLADFTDVKIKDAVNMLTQDKIDIVITNGYLKDIDYEVRRTAVDYNIPLILNARLGYELTRSFNCKSITFFELKKYRGEV